MRDSIHTSDGDGPVNRTGEQSQTFIRPSETSEQEPRCPIVLARGKYLGIVPAKVNSIAIMHDAGAPFTFVEMNAFRRC
jgi:hypothetical protein